jgi:hypothetical protein
MGWERRDVQKRHLEGTDIDQKTILKLIVNYREWTR